MAHMQSVIKEKAMELDEAAESCTIDGESPVVENLIWFSIDISIVASLC